METTLSLSGHGSSDKLFPSSSVILTLRKWSESPQRSMACRSTTHHGLGVYFKACFLFQVNRNGTKPMLCARASHQYRCSSTILVTARDTALSCGVRFLLRLTPSFSSRKSTINSDPDACSWLYSIQGILPCGDSFPSK